MIWEDTPAPEVGVRLDRLGLPHTAVYAGDWQPESGGLLTLLRGNLDRLTQLQTFDHGGLTFPTSPATIPLQL